MLISRDYFCIPWLFHYNLKTWLIIIKCLHFIVMIVLSCVDPGVVLILFDTIGNITEDFR